MLEGEPAVISNSLNNPEISFPIRQLCACWQPCPSSSLEINLFPAVLALHGKSDSSAFTSGSSHQQNVNYKSKTIYHIEREKQFSRQSKLCLVLSYLFFSLHSLLTLWVDRTLTIGEAVCEMVKKRVKCAGFATRQTQDWAVRFLCDLIAWSVKWG